MPQELPSNVKKHIGNIFILPVILVIALTYLQVMKFYNKETYSKKYLGFGVMVYLLVFHISLFMLLWSFFKTMITDPGTVPPLWGFYMGDSEQKRRRYCLMCHVFKPERCHHCSVCNRCVLNMDHHCRKIYAAWVNNCIGFFNRKFFLLLLTYVIITSWFAVFGLYFQAAEDLTTLLQVHHISSIHDLTNICFFSFLLALSVILTLFFKFHVGMVKRNITTVENMDKKNLANYKIYDKGLTTNFIQIFGRNPLLWLFPLNGRSGMPHGDGIIWHRESGQTLDDELQGTEENIKSTQRLKNFSNSLENINASRDLISPKKDESLKRDTEQTLNSFRANPQYSYDSSQL
ncbi:hypothetical protein SteCoe_4148 [Stentor coeruleus]|uniref:Palmitoyltransferase n=1 Tax=Stentor coeruleus TaxID=5963 RepID=A0A1R2CV89_9CILI|nr:hypothetical protein SteCoe_4148 [Stentor coeruleus]